MHPLVVHCKKRPFDVYVGRPEPGKPWEFGNPFRIDYDGTREEVVYKFNSWIADGDNFGQEEATKERRDWILNNLQSLRGKTLACWCAPELCHAETLATMANAETVCNWCHTNRPGRRGFTLTPWGNYHSFRADCACDPIKMMLAACKLDSEGGMNLLQDLGLVADEAVYTTDVAPVDVERVLLACKVIGQDWVAHTLFTYFEKIEERTCPMQAVA